jgi:hypothetical protein
MRLYCVLGPHCTVSVIDPEAPFAVAVMLVDPVVKSVATPVLELMLATAVLEELQVGLIAEPLFVAVNVTEPVANVAVKVPEPCERHPEQLIVRLPPPEVLTVSVVTPLMPLSAAVIVVLPVAAAVARPEPLMVATLVDDELQVTDEVMFLLVLSPKVPVAVNCWVELRPIVELPGVIEIATNSFADGKNLPQAVARSAGKMMRATLKAICCGERNRVRPMLGAHFPGNFSMRSTASCGSERSFCLKMQEKM